MADNKTPDAYGLLDEGEVHYATPFRDEAEAVLRRTEDNDSVIVPLYRSPTLTDEEREAIGVAIQCVEAAMAQRHPEEEDARDLLHKTSTTLGRLFDRCATAGRD